MNSNKDTGRLNLHGRPPRRPDRRSSRWFVERGSAGWASLSADDRARVATLWDERVEVRFFTPQEDETGTADEWEQVPEVCGGRFVPSDDDGRAEWKPDYFEYLLENPELVMAYEPARRTFHIGCTQHTAARKCLTDGHVPTAFTCPLRDANCPLLPLRGATLSVLRRGAAGACSQG